MNIRNNLQTTILLQHLILVNAYPSKNGPQKYQKIIYIMEEKNWF